MKVISLTQPWASLWVRGYKKIETRSWQIKNPETLKQILREGLLVHASVTRKLGKKPNQIDCMQLCMQPYFYECIGGMRGYYELPFGAIIGMVKLGYNGRMRGYYELSFGVTTEVLKERLNEKANIFMEQVGIKDGKRELAFGDYSPNRYGWVSLEQKEFKKPIPCKGALNIFDLPKELEAEVLKQL